MSDFSRKVHYLQGLADGMKLEDCQQLSQLVLKLLAAMGDAADAIDELYEMQSELNDYVESIDDDLYKIENDFDDDMEDGEDGFDFEAGEPEKAELHPFPGNPHSESKSLMLHCPHCLRPYRVRVSDFLDRISGICPHCGESVIAQETVDEEQLPYLLPRDGKDDSDS